MSKPLNVCVIGAGSSYTPELIEGFIDRRDELNLQSIRFVDIDRRRLDILASMAERMLRYAGMAVPVLRYEDRRRGIDGADIVVSQLRVGGQAARQQDEKIPLQWQVIGQETTGPGGFMKGMRTIPVALDIARDIRDLAPDAWLINFTNPAGMITEALLRYGHPKTIGVCNGPIGMEMNLAGRLGVERRELTLDYVGLNHLGWVRGATVGGSDVWPELLAAMVAEGRQRGDLGGFEPSLIELLGMLPSSYLRYYYHHRSTVEHARAAERTRGEEVQAIENELLKMYEDEHLCTKPKLLERRGGAYYSTLAVAIIAAIVNDKRELFIVNTRNRGAIPNMPGDVVVEVPCIIGADGARPLPTSPLPPEIGGLVHAVKAYELLAVEAGSHGSRRAATLAMLAHPLVPDYDAAAEMLDVLLESNSAYLPQFGV